MTDTAESGGIPEGSGVGATVHVPGNSKFLQVNVYPTKDGWRCSAMVKKAGEPWPRLVQHIRHEQLIPETHDIPGALRAASERLRTLADNWTG